LLVTATARTAEESSGISRVLDASLTALERYILGQRMRGYDPYDALTSPLFRLPVLRSSKWPRVAAEQALKRARYNVRPLLGIKKGYNPVTVALVLEASAYRAHTDPERAVEHRELAAECVTELDRLQTKGFSGPCWGYDFDWESRYGRLPAGTPTIVATGLVTNALFVANRLLELPAAAELCRSAAAFVLEDLPRVEEPDGTFCWAYFPGDSQRVLNATMKGARLCAQVYALTADDAFLAPATATVQYVIRHQEPEGSWPYAVGDRRAWADNFHTGYILDALDAYERFSGDERSREAKQRGWAFYRENFFVDSQMPKYYAHELYPIDATACAQSLLTLCRFGDVETAMRVARWAVESMQCQDGHFAYQIRKRRTVRIPYMRWASAYMYTGLSRLRYELLEETDAS
jgi:hypothetical protein